MSTARIVSGSRVPPRTGVVPRPQPGYYPGYHTLSQQAFWDEATRKLVLKRLKPPPIRFFQPAEARLMQAVCDRMLPQEDRDAEHRIPIVPVMDQRLYQNKIKGYQYEDMPPDREAHRLGLTAMEQIARHLFGGGFERLSGMQQDAVLFTIHDGKPPAAHEIWARMSPRHYWRLLADDVVTAYYAHPWAWDEIGYGGPAYPRGYMRLVRGQPEPWECPEQRYEWEPPPDSLSGSFRPLGGVNPVKRQTGFEP